MLNNLLKISVIVTGVCVLSACNIDDTYTTTVPMSSVQVTGAQTASTVVTNGTQAQTNVEMVGGPEVHSAPLRVRQPSPLEPAPVIAAPMPTSTVVYRDNGTR